jgi:hypothetical protein
MKLQAVRRPVLLTGRMRCLECRRSWFATWHTQAPELGCHECGAQCVPEGPQRAEFVGEHAIDATLQRLEVAAWRRCYS